MAIDRETLRKLYKISRKHQMVIQKLAASIPAAKPSEKLILVNLSGEYRIAEDRALIKAVKEALRKKSAKIKNTNAPWDAADYEALVNFQRTGFVVSKFANPPKRADGILDLHTALALDINYRFRDFLNSTNLPEDNP